MPGPGGGVCRVSLQVPSPGVAEVRRGLRPGRAAFRAVDGIGRQSRKSQAGGGRGVAGCLESGGLEERSSVFDASHALGGGVVPTVFRHHGAVPPPPGPPEAATLREACPGAGPAIVPRHAVPEGQRLPPRLGLPRLRRG
ncbi:unnamed protein product [Ectocarpus fasciculatus]